MGSVDSILQGKYPAKAHAKQVADYLITAGHNKDAVIYLESQKTRMIEDNDEPVPFRQRRAFYYLSGCSLPDSYLTYHIPTSTLTLFIPPIDPSSVMWTGLPLSPKDALTAYDVDECLPTTDLNGHLASFSHQPTTVYAIPHQVSDQTTFLGFSTTKFDVLHSTIDTCRVVKDAYEVALIRKANAITTLAHTAVVKLAKTARSECELEAEFIRACIANGCREQAYHSVVASGTAAATLHYVKNDQPLKGKLNILLDAGGEYNTYCADVTRTFPISGEFSTESQEIYSIVEEMQESCFRMLKAGVLWEEVHVNAHKIAVSGLLKLGILKGGTADELLKSRVSIAFFPHGLGHYLGMDTHDTGGNPNYADPDPMFKYLRVRGRLPAGSVITVEPGIYFCEFIVKPAMEDPATGKYIDGKVLERYWVVGGVRIEDNVHITEDGYENLTTAPKEHPDTRTHGIGGHGLGDA